MTKSAWSVLVFGLYMSFLGLGMLLIPNPVIGIVGLPATEEVWIRIAGMLLIGLGYYYVQMARLEFKPFFRFSAQARGTVILFFALFVLLDLSGPGLLVLGLIDLLAAIWTALMLREEGEPLLKFW